MSSMQPWPLPPSQPTLNLHEVHLWKASLDCSQKTIEACRHLLSPDELERADRFYFARDRNHFIAGRASLRVVLARYLGLQPAELKFDYASNGKPSLAKTMHDTELNFNMAHSANVALYGITLCGEIGVDLERIHPDVPIEEIAGFFFSAGEVARLNSLPRDLQRQAFFACWTRKEAFIKAKGIGLSLPLDQFEVTLGPEEPALLLHTLWDPNETQRWSLKAIDIDRDYAAAVAVEDHGWQLQCWQLDEKMLIETGGEWAPPKAPHKVTSGNR